ncbi:exodeoxyribonuclease VII large subunit [Pseudodonghicola xiamenensis]|uniref:Exodeoxyribonuclease 7 large subunit n=1 Tax=Pseudodonghicola xiamenensis TaxID=337702 RepID=A0A8J3H8T3_9RHOB|nr:exodeoxyribonuclease VII large subunit [Pseudodonghicola xiamenensis]GHG90710.1 exodeoxyribonuclease 7 large subunit [Pseudodonghicola xiamenensis]
MSDLIDDPQPGQNLPEFSVSEISGEIKRTLEGAFGRVRVKGEVGRVFRARSGHLYFDIKDDRNVLACTTWKGQAAALSVIPEEGMEVVVTGRLTAFGGQSKYNLNVDDVAIAGQGALMALLEKRKKQLAAEGLFAPERKKPLPYLPRIVGVVTSPSGAVIRDILHRLRDRFPRKVLIWPVAVQGANCAPEVARAIAGFNRLTPGGALPRPDLIIVARGGGSVEDLWGFNEEIVARAAAASDIPLISAVGHETDTTLIDYVADMRAPTPTAAAELAVPVRLELMAWADGMGARLSRATTAGLALRRQRLGDLSRALPRGDALLDAPRQRFDWLADRLPLALTHGVQRRRVALSEISGGLRPSALRALVMRRRDRLATLRLSLTPIRRDIAQGQERIARLSQRLDAAQLQRLDRLRRQLEATDRLRETLSYKATLDRGYAVVRAGDQVVTSARDAGQAAALEIEFRDGRILATPQAGAPETPPSAPRKAARPKRPPEQGSLF